MKTTELACLLLVCCLVVPALASARDVTPFISTDWLQKNLENPKVVIVDTRKFEDYKQGHIPGAVNSFFGAWAPEKNKLLLELPSDKELLGLIGSAGIKPDSTVVAVSMADNNYSRADATRVAFTMVIAGLKNVSVLEGGYAKWLKEKKPVSTEEVTPRAGKYEGKVRRTAVASKAYVMEKMGKSRLVDCRDANVYFGLTVEPFAPKPGHIKSAVNLPTPWIYTKEGTLLPEKDLAAMAANVVGEDKSKEVITYCGVGGYGATWWYLLTQMFGYKNVKLYDGAMQEWVTDPNAPITTFRWL